MPPPPLKSQKATVEDAEDERDLATSKKKKKKKSKKKRAETVGALPSDSTQPTTPMATQTSTVSVALPSPTKTPSVLSSVSSTLPVSVSTTSLVPSSETTTAQSAHSYLQSLGTSDKKKVKSRPDHASLFSQPDTEKKGFFPALSLKKFKDKDTEMKEARQSWMSKLSKKTGVLMHQLMMSTEPGAPMKWESFLKVMDVHTWIYEI